MFENSILFITKFSIAANFFFEIPFLFTFSPFSTFIFYFYRQNDAFAHRNVECVSVPLQDQIK